MTYDRFDLLLTAFPFTEKRGQKQRPALVLSNELFNHSHRHVVAAMITRAANTRWPSDLPIVEFTKAGLHTPSVVRMKLFTVADSLLIGRIGTLAVIDQATVTQTIGSIFGP